jgi:hypothetical protein
LAGGGEMGMMHHYIFAMLALFLITQAITEKVLESLTFSACKAARAASSAARFLAEKEGIQRIEHIVSIEHTGAFKQTKMKIRQKGGGGRGFRISPLLRIS